jgi:outer membrane protein OmpA-like peptidoglycan-associated protein
MATDISTSGAYGYSGSQSMTRVVQRRWIRLAKPIWPFVWRGLLPLLGLLLLAWWAFRPFAKSDVEATVLRETKEQLAAQGYGWAKVDVSGQHVTLSGTQPKAGDGDAALVAARAALCPSWAGRLNCAVDVQGNFDSSAPAPAAPPVAAAPPVVPAATPAPAPAAQAAKACEVSMAELLKDRQIRFRTSKADISPESANLLDELAKAAKQCPDAGTIAVQGHTDSVGAAASNKVLSQARADAVVAALAARGVNKGVLRAEGFGLDKPIATNDTVEGRAQNRRIEFRVSPK